MKIFNDILHIINKHPKLKRRLKNLYQSIGMIISDKKTTSVNKIYQISDNNGEHLFGYYDKSPWSAEGDRIIYMHVMDASKNPTSSAKAEIIMKDLPSDSERVVSTTSAWNVQQGSMLQWLGPNFNEKIIFNDYIEGQGFCAKILNVNTGDVRILPKPIYSVSQDGKYALTLDFSRLNTFRPGYGYSNELDLTSEMKLPSSTAIWRMDIQEEKIYPILTYEDIANFDFRDSMINAYHKVNHIMINPSGTRFMFLHRWIDNGIRNHRLITCDLDGKDQQILLSEGIVSHCNWKDDDTIITWANTFDNGLNYYLLKDKSEKRRIIQDSNLTSDGHPSYSPNGKWIITDTYPNFRRKQKLILFDVEKQSSKIIATIYANEKYINETRCDLHPRWKRDSSEICFDAACGTNRQVFKIEL